MKTSTIGTFHKRPKSLKSKKKRVAVGGYFSPLHSGHIAYFKAAKALGDHLIVILNNDQQMQLKRGYILQDENERKIIIENLKMVDEVVLSADTDSSISLTLSLVMPDIFAKSGDRDKSNCPEYQTCLDLGIEFIDGLINTNTHSSDFIKIIQEYYISKEITP